MGRKATLCLTRFSWNWVRSIREWSLRHAELLRAERGALAGLLLSHAEFDRVAAYRELGFATLFDCLHRELRLSRGSAHYRQVATRILVRFPEIVEPLRDGQLCLSTGIVLARVMTEANRREVLPRFFGRSRQEAEQVAVEIRPVEVVPRKTVVTEAPVSKPAAPSTANVNEFSRSPVELAPTRTLVEPLTRTETRMHVTVSPEFVALLKKAKAGESHRDPGATDEQVLTAALELLIAQQERRRPAPASRSAPGGTPPRRSPRGPPTAGPSPPGRPAADRPPPPGCRRWPPPRPRRR